MVNKTDSSDFTCLISLPRYDGNSLLSSIECYDPVIDSWEVVTSMATQRCDAGVCVLREKWSLPRTWTTGGKSKREDRQLDFAKMPLKQNHKGRFLFACMQIGKNKKEQQCGLPPLLHRPFTTWTVWQRFSFAVVDFTSEEASKEPITTCMTLFSRTCMLLSLPVRLFFQFVFKVQYISTHHKKT